MFATCRFTVCGLRASARAIVLLLSPAAINASTSFSRSLSTPARSRPAGLEAPLADAACRVSDTGPIAGASKLFS